MLLIYIAGSVAEPAEIGLAIFTRGHIIISTAGGVFLKNCGRLTVKTGKFGNNQAHEFVFSTEKIFKRIVFLHILRL
jgi:hypothetical protein